MNNKQKAILNSEISCPHCQHKAVEIMPTNASQFFYACKGCGKVLKANAQDCCVFCSFDSVPCPPIQLGSKECCNS